VKTSGFILAVLGSTAAGSLGLSWLRGTGCAPIARTTDSWPLVFDATLLGGYLLVAALVAGCISATMIVQNRTRLAGALLTSAGVIPGLVEPKAFVVTFVLIFAGLLTWGTRDTSSPMRPVIGV
jgi:hypothetical protein